MKDDVATNSRTGRTVDAFEPTFSISSTTRGTTPQSASALDVYQTLCLTVRDYMIEGRRKTTQAHFTANPKFVYYLSAEFLLGRQLTQNMLYTDTWELASQAAERNGLDLQDFIRLDREPGLGNGGLGRLAACFLDSLATLDIPAVGYGIRYEYGIFRQSFRDGWQIESPDDWLYFGNPWEFAQPDDMVEVGFGGRVDGHTDENGVARTRWVPAETVMGEPNFMLVPGYGTETVNIIRLWRARATSEFDFQLFDKGDYERGCAAEGLFGEHHQGALPERRVATGQGTAAAAAVFLCGLLPSRHHPTLSLPQYRLGELCRQSRDPAQRYPPGDRYRRADAHPRGRRGAAVGAGVGCYPAHLCLHLSHAHAGGAGGMAGEPPRAAAATASGDHLSDQRGFPERGRRPLPR